MSPRTDVENQRIRDERREKIVEAAVKVFARKGLNGTKIADIAAAAGMSHGLVYHYFASKEAVFTELVDRAMMGAVMSTQGALEQSGSPWERLCWMTSIMMQGVRYQPEYFQVALQAWTSEAVPAELALRVRQQGEIARAAMLKLIEEAQAAGEVVSGDPNQLSSAFYACIQGLAMSAAFMDFKDGSFPTVDQVMRILKA